MVASVYFVWGGEEEVQHVFGLFYSLEKTLNSTVLQSFYSRKSTCRFGRKWLPVLNKSEDFGYLFYSAILLVFLEAFEFVWCSWFCFCLLKCLLQVDNLFWLPYFVQGIIAEVPVISLSFLCLFDNGRKTIWGNSAIALQVV